MWHWIETIHRALLAGAMITWAYVFCFYIRDTEDTVYRLLFIGWSTVLMFIGAVYLFLWTLDL